MQTVIGLFENAAKAQQAAEHLINNGFSSDQVDVSTKSTTNSSSSNYASNETPVNVYHDNLSSDTSSNASTTGTMNYPGTGVTGESGMYSSHSGNNETHTGNNEMHADNGNEESFGDKVSKFFSNLFGTDDEEAGRYSTMANKTGNVVTVHAKDSDEAEKAADMLDDYGAINVNDDGNEYASTSNAGMLDSDNMSSSNESAMAAHPFDGTDSKMNADMEDATSRNTGSSYSSDNSGYTGTGSGMTGENESEKLNVIREDINIGKKQVETGGVRLRSRIVERPVEEQLRLREERVRVERTPVDRPATTADFQNFKEGVIEMTEHAEVAEVTKEARIVEEVKLAKEVNERTQNINETAHDMEVDIENIPASTTTGGMHNTTTMGEDHYTGNTARNSDM